MDESTATAAPPAAIETHPIYEVFAEKGRGASATIHEGYDLKFARPVAIKQLPRDASPAAAAAFKEEARFLSGLSHPNIVHVYDFDEPRGWIVMELMQGSLDAGPEQRVLPATKVRDVLRQALQGLQYLHGKGKLHGEIKPGNILIDEAGTVKLCDTAGVDVDGEFRRPDDSQRHVAPEVLNPEEFGSPGPGVDLYCLGLVALELLTGSKFATLFKGIGKNSANDALAWVQWHASPSATLPPVQRTARNVPNDLARVVDRLLKKHVRDRYASAADALVDLAGTTKVATEQRSVEAEPRELAVAARDAVQVTRGPRFRRRGTSSQTSDRQEGGAARNAPSGAFPRLAVLATKKRTLLACGAALGLLVLLVATSSPVPPPSASVRFIVVNERGEEVQATISIEGEASGRSGEPITVTPGTYEVTATPTARSAFETTSTVRELTAETAEQNIVVKSRTMVPPPPGDVAVLVEPRSESQPGTSPESVLSIDKFTYPVGQREFVLSRGEHQLRVEMEGHVPYDETIQVSKKVNTFEPILRRIQRSITLRVEPPDAVVEFAGKRLAGQSPYQLEKPDGDYNAYISHEAHLPKEATVQIRGDGIYRMTLQRTPVYAVRFETYPAGATLYVDGEELGTIPDRFALPAGHHEVRLQKPGFAPVKSSVDVDATSDFYFWYLNAISPPGDG